MGPSEGKGVLGACLSRRDACFASQVLTRDENGAAKQHYRQDC